MARSFSNYEPYSSGTSSLEECVGLWHHNRVAPLSDIVQRTSHQSSRGVYSVYFLIYSFVSELCLNGWLLLVRLLQLGHVYIPFVATQRGEGSPSLFFLYFSNGRASQRVGTVPGDSLSGRYRETLSGRLSIAKLLSLSYVDLSESN